MSINNDFVPDNEMGVVVKFAQLADKYGMKIINIQSAFPDAIIEAFGVRYRVEFEYISSNFIVHKHDVRECDLIICWKDTINYDFIIPVFELSSPDNFFINGITIPSDDKKEAYYWKNRAIIAERKLKHAITEIPDVTQTDLRHKYIIDYIKKFGAINKTQAALSLGVHRNTIRNDINYLISSGVVHKNGNGYALGTRVPTIGE